MSLSLVCNSYDIVSTVGRLFYLMTLPDLLLKLAVHHLGTSNHPGALPSTEALPVHRCHRCVEMLFGTAGGISDRRHRARRLGRFWFDHQNWPQGLSRFAAFASLPTQLSSPPSPPLALALAHDTGAELRACLLSEARASHVHVRMCIVRSQVAECPMCQLCTRPLLPTPSQSVYRCMSMSR